MRDVSAARYILVLAIHRESGETGSEARIWSDWESDPGILRKGPEARKSRRHHAIRVRIYPG